MNQLTLRKIPSHVEDKIRKLSKEKNQSLNKTILDLLKKALGLEKSSGKYRDLSNFKGYWDKDEAAQFIKDIEIFEQIDNDIWK
ncbi:MAG: hypothetical protein JXJ04_00330 [Spirochaetales bacterium]|nr:hypothetical protein [Spirochaetales bacterium]